MRWNRRSNRDFWDKMHNSSKSKSSARIRKNTILVITGLFFCILLFLQPILISYGRWLSPVSENLEVDIIIPQGAGLNNDRLDTAIDIYKKGKVKALVTVAISQKVLQENIAKYNLPVNDVHRGKCANRTSFDDAISAREAIQKYNLNPSSVLIVTDKYVTRRIKSLFQKVLGNSIEVRVYPSRSPIKGIRESLQDPHWWTDETSKAWVVSETQKNIFYWFYYGLLGKNDSIDVPFEDGMKWLTNAKSRQDAEKYQNIVEAWTEKVCGGKNE
jgi:DUF218 domain